MFAKYLLASAFSSFPALKRNKTFAFKIRFKVLFLGYLPDNI